MASVCYDQRVRLWFMSLDFDGKCITTECLLELNIIEKGTNSFGKTMT